MDLKEQIAGIAETHLKNDEHFIVDVVITATKGPKKILILMDGDAGVNIDDCADLSRGVGMSIEERNLIEDAYRLEVSSPGVDYPLQSIRQYKKNIGREAKISLQEGKDIRGKIVDVSEDLLLFNKEVKEGNKVKYEEVQLPFSDIKKTIVQISFK